ncbi:MAG: TIGR00730 family Rossman fold protein [Bacteroidia bacterium]|nr:TIGR00730 family Rossman fold protein [Bacteroidia bacterium]NNF30268.1 TIGR00730 family Rossman fold protein [Flavobacteriaceae bacterium]MBT8277339.1 TIGR00730 family Rossman fold protein [Bacteroidia bacterium]NNJ81583.1 TIGR00730 family Rossman fold protein [Flavobacteriaceae bacterium]NNK54275.1 TIGR00730 family Rossman fold protein [Flavobacteriaceae bacterium]
MNKLEKICVFCGSSDGNDTSVTSSAVELGEIFAQENITLVYGAAKIGIMGTIAKTVLDNHGKVIGIIPEFLKKKEVVHLGLNELITTRNMHDRKLKMQEVSDGFIALPGGLGTLEELFEILTWLQLGLHSKPIGLLNVNGFYDDLLQLFETMVRKGFVSMNNYEMLLVDSDARRLLEKMAHFKAPDIPHWLNEERA